MTDLHKALTQACDRLQLRLTAVEKEYAGYHEAEADRHAREYTLESVLDILRALLAEHPPTVTEAVVEPCPECAAGKHVNCDGTAWDRAADGPTCCPCAQAQHGGEGS